MSAFTLCESLVTAEWRSWTDIPNHAFQDCRNLRSVTITGEVHSIGWAAFDGCLSLESIILNTLMPPIIATGDGQYPFNRCDNLKVYVPNDAVQTYKDANWPNVKPRSEYVEY